MRWKILIGKVHQYLGLTIGLPFFLIAFSGAIYTWDPEIRRIIYHQKVEEQPKPFIPVSQLMATLTNSNPDLDFRTALFRGQTTSVEVLLYGHGTYYHAQLNPYSGQLLHLQDMNRGWLNYVKFLHRNLILGDVGRELVHWITLAFLILTITGIILWWPRSKIQRRKRLTIKWKSSVLKLNYDLHVVLAFYTSFICIFSTLTGLFWGFDIVKDGLQRLTKAEQDQYEIPKSDTTSVSDRTTMMHIVDSITQNFIKAYPKKSVRISIPHGKEDVIRISTNEGLNLVSKVDHVLYDQYTGQNLQGNFRQGPASASSTYQYLEALMYDIHLGNIGGLTGRILLCLCSLIAASLPITGFIIWYSK